MGEIIGVIGGNGVAATNKLCEMIENKLTLEGAFRDAHHPEMIIWQATKVPSRSMFLEGKGESFIPGYIDIARKLESCGATKLCMCCNTAHFAVDEIQQAVKIPFIDMIEAVVLEIKKSGIKRVGIMASEGCVRFRIYDRYIHRICPWVEAVYPNKEYQAMVTKGICKTKSKDRISTGGGYYEKPENIFRKVENYLLQEEGVDLVVSGCTDIRAAYLSKGIDSLEVLCNKIIQSI